MRLHKAFMSNSSANIKSLKTHLHKTGQSGGRVLGPLLKTGLLLMKNVLKPLTKSVLIPLGFTAAASAAYRVSPSGGGDWGDPPYYPKN